MYEERKSVGSNDQNQNPSNHGSSLNSSRENQEAHKSKSQIDLEKRARLSNSFYVPQKVNLPDEESKSQAILDFFERHDPHLAALAQSQVEIRQEITLQNFEEMRKLLQIDKGALSQKLQQNQRQLHNRIQINKIRFYKKFSRAEFSQGYHPQNYLDPIYFGQEQFPDELLDASLPRNSPNSSRQASEMDVDLQDLQLQVNISGDLVEQSVVNQLKKQFEGLVKKQRSADEALYSTNFDKNDDQAVCPVKFGKKYNTAPEKSTTIPQKEQPQN